MVRRSMVLLMVLLAAALLIPNSALAAKDGSSTNYRAKVFTSNSSGTVSVSATFTCSPIPSSTLIGSLTGSFFYQLANGSSIYGDMTTPTCPAITSPDGNWSTPTAISSGVIVESMLGNKATGTITLVFQNAPNGHSFTSPSVSCNCVINLMLSDLSNPMTMFTQTGFNGGTSVDDTSATLSLSVRG